jgi:alpha-methylacyl-CoA racemase
MNGPLTGYRVIEVAGIGPGPFAAMVLADMGAEVIRVERVQAARSPAPDQPRGDLLLRGRRNLAIDLKHPDGVGTLLDLVAGADALIEGFRPGVMERLGAGPDECLSRNPKLVYGRMTGWGQDGPLAPAAGHDINYISLAGALAHFRRAGEPPTPPLNLVGDFGGGGMLLAFGVVCALLEAQRGGRGQVVDAAMVDGTALLMTMFWGLRDLGLFDEGAPGTNLLDSGAHFYDVYECSDGTFLSIGALEPQFYAELLERLGLAGDERFAAQMDHAAWPQQSVRLAELIRTRTRAEWCSLLEGTDACVAPVLTLSEAPTHPHNAARGTFIEANGRVQPAPAPRFSRTPGAIGVPPAHPGEHSREILAGWGLPPERIDALIASGAVVDTRPAAPTPSE